MRLGSTHKDDGIWNDVSWLVLSSPELSTEYLTKGKAGKKDGIDRKFLKKVSKKPSST